MKDGALAWSKAPTSLSAHLAESVLSLIKDERLEAGDRLPSVKELAERFSVATPTMREALRLLANGRATSISATAPASMCGSPSRG